MQALPVFLLLRNRDVMLFGDGEGAAPKRRLLEAAGANIVTRPTPGTRIAVLAIDDADEAAHEAARLRAAGLLVNVVDKPALCDFSFPAIVDRAPITIAIGSGGASATLSKTLRERLEALLPARLGEIAQAVRTLRPRVNQTLDTPGARRLFWDGLMAPGAALDPLGAAEQPEAAILDALAAGQGDPSSVYDLRPRSADPDDLTLRDLRELSRADVILSCPGASKAIEDRGRRDAERGVFTPETGIPSSCRVVILRAH
ncbi:siroheme synthase [Pacificimonas sp. WHA3]|uniref:precorrin-2 dehydrogenase n=1 Tax=Pacificimonas pallii TaxID=2827236 RepID=A0ABS6SHN4_9SPHN|nr:NAD(P)-dependent oxidoreductase [Pacificimonas pallii]MBV7257426.1 siroheme synthase [Pacificimonas pallii]